MEDKSILNLYNSRDESAITQTASKYGGYCTKIAMNILRNAQDADEVVNDTWLKAWNSIPPMMPAVLSSFLGRITRNHALNALKSNNTKKRGGTQVHLVLEELDECIQSGMNTQEEFEAKETENVIGEFLYTIKEESQVVFVRRYWHYDSIADIARRYKISESKVKSILLRTRNKLKLYLEERGIIV
jgi:RNA polymerase sigma-70 factor (ECF subfamily)